MAARSSNAELQNQLSILSIVGAVGDLTDGQLLQRFLCAHQGEGQAAFTALVERHGPLVLHVCREVLGDSHDSDDAFQATFLVLFRKARSVRKADSVASWLHGVALRVARRAKADSARRMVHERRGAEMRANDSKTHRPESWPELHEEIGRLPARYREPLVLCYLEGLSSAAVAQRLRCPQGTILSRLSRGRQQLRARLIRRGLAPVNSDAARTLPTQSVPANVPGPLLAATLQLVTGLLEEPAAVGLIQASVASLTKGVLQAMLWHKLKMGGLAGLALAAIIVGAGAALAYQETKTQGRVAPSPNMKRNPAAAVVSAPGAANAAGLSAAVIVPMPPRAELRRLLRRAASEAVVLAKNKPVPNSWCLTTIATAQAKAGDLDGARVTFADAATQAGGGFGGRPNSWNLWRVGHSQAECNLRAEARTTLAQGVKALPGASGEDQTDLRALDTFAVIARDQAGIGAHADSRKTVELLLAFSQKYLESTKTGNARAVAARKVAPALAAVGDFDAAFRWSEGFLSSGDVLGEIAVAASKSLDRPTARRFVREAADRLAKLRSAEETYFGLINLAEAQARLGDVEAGDIAAAKRSARAIGEAPSRFGNDMSDGQPCALGSVAALQYESGDTAGARETLREAYRSVRDHPKMRERDGRYGQIARGQLAVGDLAGALQTVAAIEINKAAILAPIARAQAAAGDHAAARATFARALADAGLPFENPPPANREQTKPSGKRHPLFSPELAFLAEIKAMAGDVPGALQTLRSIDDEFYERSGLERIVSARATAGDVAGALRLCLKESKTQEERVAALQGLGQGVDTRLSKALDLPAR
jgi:RNA polymerase sigma factor (sigma-70 family)